MIRKIATLRRKHQVVSAFFIGVAVVAFWRGVWGLMDLYIFPDHLTMSYIASVVIGLIILYITDYIVQELM